MGQAGIENKGPLRLSDQERVLSIRYDFNQLILILYFFVLALFSLSLLSYGTDTAVDV